MAPWQSTAISPWFWMPSEQVPAAHFPITQWSLPQSAPMTHPDPAGHALGHSPPQSTPVSVPFLTPSEHDAGAHAPPMQ
jgi:hypothetical protein